MFDKDCLVFLRYPMSLDVIENKENHQTHLHEYRDYSKEEEDTGSDTTMYPNASDARVQNFGVA